MYSPYMLHTHTNIYSIPFFKIHFSGLCRLYWIYRHPLSVSNFIPLFKLNVITCYFLILVMDSNFKQI